jgi:hypothetical protein
VDNTDSGGTSSTSITSVSNTPVAGSTPGSAPGLGPPAPLGRGDAADGQVQATATCGRVESLELDPRLMRLSGEQLAGHVATAVEAALEDARGQSTVGPAPDTPPVDPRVLAARLGQVHDQGVRAVEMITQALGDAVALLRDRTGMAGDVSPRGLPELLAETHRTVARMAGPAEEADGAGDGAAGGAAGAGEEAGMGAAGAEFTGHGEAAGGLVHANTAAPDGRLTALEIDGRLMRLASHDLAAQVLLAVNGALTDLRDKLRERSAFSPVDPERLAALREASTQQMTAYARSLRDLVAAIKPR